MSFLKNLNLVNDAQAYGLPIQGTDVAVAWDHLYLFLFWLSVFFFVLVVGGMIYLAFAYKAGKGHKTKYIVDNHKLEIFWTLIPTALLMVIFVWGWQVYKSMTRAPYNAMEIRVLGKQWAWAFQYDNGKTLTNELYVPQNKPVKLVMTSEDVIHSFFVPNFRVKSDVVPGLYTSVWFEAKVPGEHQVFCTEYCGASHSLMLAKLYVLESDKWEKWYRGESVEVTKRLGLNTPNETPKMPLTLADQGKKLTEAKGCTACHNVEGAGSIGPNYTGLYGSVRTFQDGSTATADESYIRESILASQKRIVKGFNPVMPAYQGQISESEINAIVAYIKTLSSNSERDPAASASTAKAN